MRVRGFAEAQVRDRITREAVGPALKQDKFGREGVQMGFDLLPSGQKLLIPRSWRQRQIEFGPGALAPALFRRRTGARVQMLSVLVDVRERQVWIILERV